MHWLWSWLASWIAMLPVVVSGGPAHSLCVASPDERRAVTAAALGMKPPQFLKAGDVVTMGIQGLGEQRQRVVVAK